jgi:MFS family permease
MGSKIWRIVGAAFVGMLGFGAVIPMLPVYLREQAGASTFVTGLFIGLSSAFALLGRLFAGKVADHRGRRTALLMGMGFCAAAGVLYLPFFGIAAMAPARVLHGLGEGFFVTAAVAWAVDIAPSDRRAQALGLLSSGIWGGVSVGPAIGQALGTMARVAVFLTVSSVVVIAIVLLMHEELRPKAVVPARWFPPQVVLPGVILGCGNVTYAAMSGFLILLLHERGHNTAWAFSAFAFAVLFGRFLFGGLPDRMGPRRTLLIGYVFLGAGLIAIAVIHNSAFDIPAALLVGLGYAFPWPALASVVVSRVAVSERASALGALTAFYDLFVAASSAVAGAIAGHFGLTSVFWFAFACVPAAVILTLTTGIGGPSTSRLRIRTSAPSLERRNTSSTPKSVGTAGSD